MVTTTALKVVVLLFVSPARIRPSQLGVSSSVIVFLCVVISRRGEEITVACFTVGLQLF